MAIRKGEDWGSLQPLGSDDPIVGTDAELAALVADALANGASVVGPVGLLGGDVCRTLGGLGDAERLLSPAATSARIDVLRTTLDDGPSLLTVAHLLVHGWCWNGPGAAIMNAAWVGEWNIAPAAHPGDGRVDVVQGSLPVRQRLEARRRVRSGTHLPHPSLTTAKQRSGELDLGRRRGVWSDGRRVGTCRSLRYEVLPDICAVVV